VKNYIPETLGGRNAGLSACLGLFYAYNDRRPITGYADNSLDMETFIKSVSYRENRANGNPEDTLTKKLKGILFDAKK
jgi:cell division protein FtsA